MPPEAPWSGQSESLIARPDDPWITPSEKDGLTTSPSYADTRAFLEKMAAASPLIRLKTFGKTPLGRDLIVAIVSRDDPGKTDPKLDPNKPVLLAQAGIHSGEIDGKDAGLMLLRDIAFKGKGALLDRANLLFVPIFNVDGHERASEFNRPNQRGPVVQGWRTTAQNLNLNRDYAKLDAPEMQAMIALIRAYKPDLYMDLHVTDGMDYQYDITYGFQGDRGGWAASPNIAAWLAGVYRRDADAALSAMGHTPGPLIFENNPRKPELGLVNDGFSPRFSQTYGDMIHMASLLVENHSLKNFRRRVLGTYVLLEQSLKTLARDGRALREAAAKDRALRPQQLPVAWITPEKQQSTVDFLPMAFERWTSPASGTEEIRWLGRAAPPAKIPLTEVIASQTADRPKAYWVPPTKPDVIARLKWHGIEMETLSAPRTVTVDMLRLPDAKPASQPFEGRFGIDPGKPVRETRNVDFLPGTMRVPTDQPLGNLAMVLLEPQSEDSFFAWGFFPEILQRTEYAEGYVMAPLAERMMAADAKLKAEFEAKLAAEPDFAKNPSARLSWFYARTPYYDDAYLLYPVGIEQ
ncbi:MAG: M14 family metallopeptidase [Rhodospirillaceae bacterium]|nr:M14 family metallopeptidase [Rhodospirillaceae bacterium]